MTDQPTAYTYEDAARLCGVTSETIRQRARRGKMRKGRPTNTNRPTVLLTQDEIEVVKSGRSLTLQPTERPDVQPDGQSSAISALNGQVAALTDHVTTLRDQLIKAEATMTVERAERIAAQAEVARFSNELLERNKVETTRDNDHDTQKAEIERLNALVSRPWWRRIVG